MKRLCTALLLFFAWVAPAFAQQGHPLTGTWQGDWGPNANTRHFLTLIMEWDGKRITGIANPGPDSTEIDQLTLNAADWSVAIDMDLKDSEGKTVHFRGTGKLNELGSQNRVIEGTWNADGQSGTFTLTRQSGA